MATYQVSFEYNDSDTTDNIKEINKIIEEEQQQKAIAIYISGSSINDAELYFLSRDNPSVPLIVRNIDIEKVEIKTSIESELTFDDCKIKDLHLSGSSKVKLKDVLFINNCEINELNISGYDNTSIKIEGNCKFINIKLSKMKAAILFSISNSIIDGIIEIEDSDLYRVDCKSFKGNFGISNSKISYVTLIDFILTKFYFSRSKFRNISLGYNKQSEPIFTFLNCQSDDSDFLLNLNHISNLRIEFCQTNIHQNKEIILLKGENSIVKFDQCTFLDEISFIDTKTLKRDGIKLILKDTVFRQLVTFEKTQPENLEVFNTLFQNGISIPISDNYSNSIHSSVWCVLKNQAIQRNDRIKALEYRKLEMEAYTRELKNESDKIPEKLVLYLNKLSNNHGLSWEQGVLFTIVNWALFYTLFIWSGNNFNLSFLPKNILWVHQSFWNGALAYLWLPSGIEELKDVHKTNLNWIAFISTTLSFLFGKIIIAYGIYQTVAAFRKHGKI